MQIELWLSITHTSAVSTFHCIFVLSHLCSTFNSGQIAATRAAASFLAVEGGALPDEGLPSAYHSNEHDELSEWQDIDDNEGEEEMEISHEGGERLDRARTVFEYIILPRCAYCMSATRTSQTYLILEQNAGYVQFNYNNTELD